MNGKTSPKNARVEPAYARASEIAHILGVSERTIWRWTKEEGLLPCIRLKGGSTVLWPIEDCLAIVEQYRVKALSEVE